MSYIEQFYNTTQEIQMKMPMVSSNKYTLTFEFIICMFSDMRKALSRDTNKKSVIPLSHPVRPEDIE